MKKYSCYILDDEPLAIKLIQNHLVHFDQFSLSGFATNPIVAWTEIRKSKIELLFLDIEMPEMSGLEFIDSIRVRPEIIITTAYRNFAVEGFDLDVLDYLVKPISFKRFAQSMDKFLSKYESDQVSDRYNKVNDHIFIHSDRKNIKLFFEDILYLEGLKDYTRIVTTEGKILTKASLGVFLKKLPPAKFIRIHKSYAISVSRMSFYTMSNVNINAISLPIGRAYKQHFLNSIEQ